MPLGSEEAQAESLLWFLGNGGGYVNSAGKYDINSAQNVATLKFMSQLVKAGDTQPSPGTTDRKDVWASVRGGQDRHDARLPGGDPDHPGRGQAASPPTTPPPTCRARPAR